MYLIAIVLANLSIYYFGVRMVYVNALLFIGLDLTARDKLHDLWHNDRLWIKMLIMIGAGSLISWLLNQGAGQIAIASFVAFMVAGLVDTITYNFLFRQSKLIRINGSNLFSSMTDSIVFPTIAFGSFIPVVVFGQFITKIIGGFLWAVVLQRLDNKKSKNILRNKEL